LLAWVAVRVGAAATAPARLARPAATAVGAFLVLALGSTAYGQSRRSLADAPHETRLAGEALARMGISGAKIVARKPHVAYFARMQYVPLPLDQPLAKLASWARGQGADYLFFSGLEQITQPGYGVLADSALSLPGFEQILWRRLSPRRFFAVYRLHAAPVDSLAFTHAYLEALARYEAHYPGAADVQLFVAAQLLDLHEPAEALSRLDGLRRAGAHDPVVERLRATALVETGDDEGAAGAFLEAMRLEPPSAALWAQLGRLRMRQSRLPDALQCFQQAVDLEPATLEYLELLGRAQVVAHDLTGATGTFERCVRLAPADLIARRLAMGAWQLAGNDRRVRELYAQGVNAGLSPASLLGGEGGGPSTISATSSKASAHDRGRRQTGMNGHSGAAHSP
jgi:Flp pilus assembly protein TadD